MKVGKVKVIVFRGFGRRGVEIESRKISGRSSVIGRKRAEKSRGRSALLKIRARSAKEGERV